MLWLGRCRKEGGNVLVENKSTSADELMEPLKRYLKESGETERTVASRIGLNYHTLRRWLSDKDKPAKRKACANREFSQTRRVFVKMPESFG
jgi:hypothetical protein